MLNLPSFRGCEPSPQLALNELPQIIEDVLRAGNFFLPEGASMRSTYSAHEERVWEIFRGRLLDASQTRQTRTFSCWNIQLAGLAVPQDAPLLGILHDQSAAQLHVTRAIYCHVWEGYDSGGGVILSRETTRSVWELLGTIQLNEGWQVSTFRDELICLLFQAVVGASRLPLTSVEAPHPLFSLGQLAYAYRKDAPSDSVTEIIPWIDHALRPELAWLEKAKLLETMLRACPDAEIEQIASQFVRRWQAIGHEAKEVLALLRTLFNEVALTPYTGFIARTRQFLSALVANGWTSPEEYGDFLSYLLRQAARHLTAYDLVTYHHRGANYPDALLVNEIWQDYAAWCEAHPSLVRASRLRRRALRQGWMVRKLCEGLLVPDAPTSPGENVRILPAPFERVPDEQILNPAHRQKTLFSDDTLPIPSGTLAGLMRESLLDLRDPNELQELGTALFLDRPLGCYKSPGEPDLTMLFSHEAFSKSIASARLAFLVRSLHALLSKQEWSVLQQTLKEADTPTGIHVVNLPTWQRPGVVSLADAVRAADDFLIVRTTRQTLHEFVALVPNGQAWAATARLILPGEAGTQRLLAIYDEKLSIIGRIEIKPGAYVRRAGKEYPDLRVIESSSSPAQK